MTEDKKKEEEKKHVQMKNMFSNFAANYAKTLDTLIDQSNKFLQNKALARRRLARMKRSKTSRVEMSTTSSSSR